MVDVGYYNWVGCMYVCLYVYMSDPGQFLISTCQISSKISYKAKFKYSTKSGNTKYYDKHKPNRIGIQILTTFLVLPFSARAGKVFVVEIYGTGRGLAISGCLVFLFIPVMFSFIEATRLDSSESQSILYLYSQVASLYFRVLGNSVYTHKP